MAEEAEGNGGPEYMEFEVDGGPSRTLRLKSKDGEVTLDVTFTVVALVRAGNEPNTGLPTFNVWCSWVNGVQKADASLTKRPKPPSEEHRRPYA